MINGHTVGAALAPPISLIGRSASWRIDRFWAVSLPPTLSCSNEKKRTCLERGRALRLSKGRGRAIGSRPGLRSNSAFSPQPSPDWERRNLWTIDLDRPE